jgi:hypothetical protein
MREGKEDPGAVAGERIGGDRSAVLDPAQGLEGGVHDRPRCPPPSIGDEADATGIPFGGQRVVQGHGIPF